MNREQILTNNCYGRKYFYTLCDNGGKRYVSLNNTGIGNACFYIEAV